MGRSLAFGCACVATLAMSGSAVADRLTEEPEVGPRIRLSKRIKANLNDYGNHIGNELSNFTLGLLDLRFDLIQKDARFHLGGGDPEAFRLRIDSYVLMQRGTARVQAHVDLAVAGHRLAFQMPDLDLRSKSVTGKRDFQLNLPLLEGRF